jgi:hypothetical protein
VARGASTRGGKLLDGTEVAQITTIVGAVIAAGLSLIAVFQGGRIEERLDSVADAVRGLNTRLDTFTSQQFHALLGYVQQLTGNFSDTLVRIEDKVGRLLERQ